MKTTLKPCLLFALAVWLCCLASAHAQTAAFTYQGRLMDNGSPANGEYDLVFSLHDALTDGNPVGSPINVVPVTVNNGVFTVTLDFGSTPFIGFNRWLEISVRTNGDTGTYTTLTPRQAITSTPYATFAGSVNSAGIIGQLTDSQIATTLSVARTFNNPNNQFTGNGSGLTSLSAGNLVGSLALGMNSSVTGTDSGITGGQDNSNSADRSFIGAGINNVISGDYNIFLGAGGGNEAKGLSTFLGAGADNFLDSNSGVLVGGIQNDNQGNYSFLGAGALNRISSGADYAVIVGGEDNSVSASYGFAGGRRATAAHMGSFVWADPTGASFASTAPNQFLIRAGGGMGINKNDPQTALDVNGTITATAFAGDASGLTGIAAANITGTLSGSQLAAGSVPASAIATGTLLTPQAVDTEELEATVNTSYSAIGDEFAYIELPSEANLGDIIQITGAGTGGWGATAYDPFYWYAYDSVRDWTEIASSADGSKLVAAVGGSFSSGQLYTSTDYGYTWTARESVRGWRSVASSADGTKLVAAPKNNFLYTSSDSGVTWTARDSQRNWNSVASSTDGTVLAAAVNGGQLYVSTDSGDNWTATESTRNWRGIACSEDGTKMVAVALGHQIYTSTDSGQTWVARENSRAWKAVASSSDGTKLIAVVGDGGASSGLIYTSTDSGVTWTPRATVQSWQSVTSSADGTRLAAVTSNAQIYVSNDSGVTWYAKESDRKWRGIACTADGSRLFATAEDGYIYIADAFRLVSTGDQGEGVTLQYLGNGHWAAVNSPMGGFATASLSSAQGVTLATEDKDAVIRDLAARVAALEKLLKGTAEQ